MNLNHRLLVLLASLSLAITSCSSTTEEIAYQAPTSESVMDYLNLKFAPGCRGDVCIEIQTESVEATDKPWVWCANLVTRTGTPIIDGNLEGVVWDDPTSSRQCYRVATNERGAIEYVESTDSETNSNPLPNGQCNQLEAFAERDVAGGNSDALKFWDLEEGFKNLYKAIEESSVNTTEEEKSSLRSAAAVGIEKRRQDIASKAGEFASTLESGSLKTAMENLAKNPSDENLGTIRELAKSCNLTNN